MQFIRLSETVKMYSLESQKREVYPNHHKKQRIFPVSACVWFRRISVRRFDLRPLRIAPTAFRSIPRENRISSSRRFLCCWFRWVVVPEWRARSSCVELSMDVLGSGQVQIKSVCEEIIGMGWNCLFFAAVRVKWTIASWLPVCHVGSVIDRLIDGWQTCHMGFVVNGKLIDRHLIDYPKRFSLILELNTDRRMVSVVVDVNWFGDATYSANQKFNRNKL